MTPGESAESEPEPFESAMRADRFLTVVRAGGFVATKGALRIACGDPFQHGGKGALVDADEHLDEEPRHAAVLGSLVRMPARLASFSRSATRS